MSVSEAVAPKVNRVTDRRWTATALAGAAQLLGLGAVLMGGVPTILAVAAATIGAAGAIWLLAPQALRALLRHRGLFTLLLLVGLGAWWIAVGLSRAGTGSGFPRPFAYPSGLSPFFAYRTLTSTGWPLRLGHVALLPLALTLLSAAGGFVLIADAARVQLGLAPQRRVPWRLMTAPLERRGRIAWRAVPGILLIGWAAFLGIGLASPYVAGDAALEAAVLLIIGGWAAVLIASPLLVGALMRTDLDKAGRAREEERARFAAHLHDSVLQTLALVQRQAHDPAAVVRLARRQEHALRAWMAGEAELVSETLGGALREVVAEVEDEHAITIELTGIGDRPLDPAGEALVAAAREALRNAARHAVGAPVFVFAEISASRAQIFVRDEGPGFDLDAVAAERRGIRDAVIGRMAVVGGRATIESTPGEGTEVTLHLGQGGAGR